MSLYTKTGDNGTTGLYTGERRLKDDVIFQVLGDIDEANSQLGLSIPLPVTYVSWMQWLLDPAIEEKREYQEAIEKFLRDTQSRLLDLGSCIATPLGTANEVKLNRTRFSPDHVTDLELWIDELSRKAPPLKNFILPGNAFHMVRCTVRRAERSAVTLAAQGEVDPVVIKYLNRLSDFFFALARFVSYQDGKGEIAYCKAK